MEAIVAISTPPGYGGIGIIRISGKDSFKIIEKIFEPKNKEKDKIKGYTMKYGKIFDFEGKIIDEVLVTYFVSPKSFTTENMCEINSHGGPIVVKKILELCLENGARMAEPGEFTKIAFLNGRIDLAQSEAIIDMINAKTEKEQQASINQLEGNLSNKINEIREDIMQKMVDIEASIDYPEYDIEEITKGELRKMLERVNIKLKELERNFEKGKLIKDGIKMAIIGRPNAGKSSLLNAILNEDRAIVTEYEGTTRDIIEEFIVIEGIPIKVIDTAGIRNKTEDKIEQIGIEKAKEIAKNADLVIYIIDSSKKLEDEDKEILKLLKDKKVIIVLNKQDLNTEISVETEEIKKINKPKIKLSALKKDGIEQLYKEISEMFRLGEIIIDDSVTVTNERHKEIIKNAQKNTNDSINSIDNNMPIDIIQISIKQTLEELGKITGNTVSEDIIDEIFKKFCLGK
ncbi:MAG: tRNA uridine-5-carboxymethylaminomethyl(34) synthesis GTPase MnmE [Clostridia bacterium]|nr:tRNA uridine-5-carboxymethylaminomethyl(34) synthesis GTPase MnmE [Clostridia bacterium]